MDAVLEQHLETFVRSGPRQSEGPWLDRLLAGFRERLPSAGENDPDWLHWTSCWLPTVIQGVDKLPGIVFASDMPWVKEWDEPKQGAIFVRRCQAKWAAREDLSLALWERETGTFVGSSGLHRIDWSVPNVEIGYWIRTGFEGRGFVIQRVDSLRTLVVIKRPLVIVFINGGKGGPHILPIH